MGQALHLRNWGSDESQMEKCRSDGEAGDTFARRMYIACRYTAAVQPAIQKWGYVESQYRKFKQWSLVRTVSGWLVCGRSDIWIVGGWIYSKPVGWLICLLLSVVWSDLWSVVVGLPAGLFAIRSVGRLNHPAGLLSNLSPTDRPTIHPYIWSLTNRPKTVLLSVLASDQCLNFRYRGFDVSPFSSGWLAAVGLPDPCLQVSGQVWGVFHLASQGGIPSSIAYPRIDLGTLNKGCVTCFVMPCISTYIFSCCIQLPVLPIPPTCNGLKSIFGDTPHWFSQHPLNWNPGKGLVWGFESWISLSNCSFYRFSTFEPSLGRDMLPTPRDLHPLPYPHFGEGEF